MLPLSLKCVDYYHLCLPSDTVDRLVQVEFQERVKSLKSKRFWEMFSEYLHTCPCQPVYDRCVSFFPPDFWSYILFGYLGLKPPPSCRRQKKHPLLTGREGRTEHACNMSGSISQKWRRHLSFCPENMRR